MRVLAPLGTFVAVTAVAVTASLVGGGNGGPGTPRVLNLAGATTQDAAALAPGAKGGDGTFTLDGELPKGVPADAPAWKLPGGPGSSELVARLAAALKQPKPVRSGDGWRAGGLSVSGEPGRMWSWSTCGPDTPVSSSDDPVAPEDSVSSGDGKVAPDGGVSMSCHVAVGSGGAVQGSTGSGSAPSVGAAEPAPATSPNKANVPVPPPSAPQLGGPAVPPEKSPLPPPPGGEPQPLPGTLQPKPIPTEKARLAAAPVLQALGLQDAEQQIDTGPYGASVRVTPQVDGLDVFGFTTWISVDSDGTVVTASGWLSQPERADSYPLISAQAAFDALPAWPRMLMPCAITEDGKGCEEPAPPVITGAHLGLQLQQLVGGEQLLVPAWLFAVRGNPEPVAVVAVAPRFLGTGTEPKPSDGTIEPDPAPSEPGQTEPDRPAREPLRFDAARPTNSGLIVTYGDSGSCPHTGVTQSVKEDDKTVVVLLEADTMPADRACTADYKAIELPVKLQAPLGNRTVIDGSTGQPVS